MFIVFVWNLVGGSIGLVLKINVESGVPIN